MGKMSDAEWGIGPFCPMSHKGTWAMAGQEQLYRSLDKCHRGPLPWSTLEKKVTHLPGFLDVFTSHWRMFAELQTSGRFSGRQ